MRLCDYLDEGASLGPDAPCLSTVGRRRSYAEVQRLSWLIGRALARSGIRPGDKVVVLAGNDPVAFSCVFGIARAGAIWCPVDPQNDPARTLKVLDHIDCSCLIFSAAVAPLARRIAAELPKLRVLVCLDSPAGVLPGPPTVIPLRKWLAGLPDGPFEADQVTDVAAILGAGTDACDAKGVLLTRRNIETMSQATLSAYPFAGRPSFLAITPLTRGLGVFAFPVMSRGGEMTLLSEFEATDFLAAIAQCRITHLFLPSTLLGILLEHHALADADLSSLQCVFYDGADAIPAERLSEAITRVGPVFGSLYGQPEVMVIAAMAPGDNLRPDGTLTVGRLASAGRPVPLTTVGIMDEQGRLKPAGEHGEVVARGPLVTAGYYADPARSVMAFRYGWYHTGDFGYLDAAGYLYVLRRGRDLIATGRFNVYSAEVEQALLGHPAVQSATVMASPDASWGEGVTAVIQARPGFRLADRDMRAFLRERLGKRAPSRVVVWSGMRRTSLGGAIKHHVRSRLLGASG